MAKTLMVGISTAQNIVNILPAVQLSIDLFCFIETDFAQKLNWAEGSEKVLKRHNIKSIKPILITNEDNSNLFAIVQSLINRLSIYQKVIFNLGGGQKIHSIALWECFAARSPKFQNDSACYIDQTTKKINVFNFDDGKVKTSEIDIGSKLNAIDIFEIFGFEVIDSGATFYGNESSHNSKLTDFTIFSDFRTFTNQSFKTTEAFKDQTFSIEEIKGMFGAEKALILKNRIENSITSLKTVGSTISINKKQYDDQFYNCILKTIKNQILESNLLFGQEFELKDQTLIQLFESEKPICNTRTLGKVLGSTFGVYFEKLLIQRILLVLNKNNHAVISAVANLKIKRGNDKAEYDIVLVTKEGTLIVLDAKTDEFSKKDEDARNFNLLASAGAYAKFIPVYLFYPEDLNENILSQSIKVKIKDSSLNKKQYLTYNSEVNNMDIYIENEKIKLNPINEILKILKLS